MKSKTTETMKTNHVFQKESQVFLPDRGNDLTTTCKPISLTWVPFKNYNNMNIWFFLVLLFGLSFLTSCDKDDHVNVGSRNLTSEIREVAEFTQLKSTGVFEVTITQGSGQSVEITTDDNIIGRVRTHVVDGELRLELTDGSYENITLRARITVEQLNGINNSGVGNIIAQNIDTDEFTLSNSGDAEIILSGVANNLDCFNEGAGDVRGFNFLVNNAGIEVRGSGSVEISCTDTLDVEIDGSGDVLYRGNPTVNSSVRGSGEVRKIGE